MKTRNAIIGKVKVKNGICYKKSNLNNKDIFTYLNSKNFDNIPRISYLDGYLTYDYINDLSINDYGKAKDLIITLANLHQKSVFVKDIDLVRINELKDKYISHVNYYLNYFTNLFNTHINYEYQKPSTYLILRNYTLITTYLNMIIKIVNQWYQDLINNPKVRLSIIHNNVSLDHFIHNEKNYLISWDHCRNDIFLIDLVLFYQKYFNQFSFNDLFGEYNNIFSLDENEKRLFKILLLLNFNYEEKETELLQVKNNTLFILYLNKTLSLIKVL